MTMVTGLTVEEFLDGDFPAGAELIDGKVVVNDPSFEHQAVCAFLLDELARWIRIGNGFGYRGFGGNWTVGAGHVLKPDVWWARERPTGVRSDRPPELAVEVRSPENWRYDIGPKMRIYESVGVAELWLVDPPGREVLVYGRSTPKVAEFDVALTFTEAEVVTSPLLPGFSLPVGDVMDAAR